MIDGRAVLEAFDGTHVAALKPLVHSDLPDSDLLSELPGPNEIAASWVLKARLEAGLLDDAACREVFASLSVLSEPDAILHLLQMVQHAPYADAARVRPFLNHQRVLVRVWALDALARIAPDEAAPLIEAALGDRSAAMRARARALKALI